LRLPSDGGRRPPSTSPPPWPSLLGATVIRPPVGQRRQAREQRRVTPPGVLDALQHPQLPVPGVLGVSQPGAGRWPLRVFADRPPARLLVREPAPDALPRAHPGCVRPGCGTARGATGALATRSPPVASGAGCARGRGRCRDAPPEPGAADSSGGCPRQRRLLDCRPLERALGRGERGRAGLRSVPQRPAHTATDHRGERRLLGQTVPRRLIRQARPGQGQPPPGAPRDQTLVTHGPPQARARPRRELVADRPALHTPSARPRPQGVARHLRGPLALAQDAGRQPGAHGATRGALETPAGDPTAPETASMPGTRHAPAAATGRLLLALHPERAEERQPPCEQRLAVATPLNVGRGVLTIDGAGPLVSRRFGRAAQVAPPGPQVSSADATRWESRIARSRQP
jgi:hypothetical protein